jgi:hypothetical protein
MTELFEPLRRFFRGGNDFGMDIAADGRPGCKRNP